MNRIKEENRLLASLAVFRELYDVEKDVYGIISTFLNEIIRNESLYSFDLNEITEKLNSTYEFEIPPAVVKTSLARLKFIEKDKTNYLISDVSKIKGKSINKTQKNIEVFNQSIFDNLIEFIESKKSSKLSDSEKEKISHSFCSFLLDKSNGDEYIEYITTFILENDKNVDFKNQLNLIREGVIIYTGIKFNNNLNDVGSWNTELTIYLETEILFHLAGFNGEVFKNLAMDFISLVKEINTKAKKKLIQLKYFNEVKVEIDGFFTKAKHLINGNVKPNPNVTAMVSIVNGCNSPSDVLDKKTDFFLLLKGFGILEDTYQDYFESYNHKYNVINEEILTKVSEEIGKEAAPYLKFLNYVSIHRRELKENNFESIKYILLSGNATTIKVAWNDLIKEDGNVPLATHLSFLTNKFWFKLNKGFGKNILPKSFDVITKAQIVLSKVLNDNVGEKYEELKSKFENGDITKDQASARIVNLRDQVRKPEEIKSDIAKDVLSVITEDSLDLFLQEQSFQKVKAKKQVEENVRLQSEIKASSERENLLKDTNIEIEEKLIESKCQTLKEKQDKKFVLEKQKKPLDKRAESKYKYFKNLLIWVSFVYYILLVVSIFYFTWDIMEKYTYILGLIPIVFSIIYPLVNESTVNPVKFLNSKREKIYSRVYAEFDFDNSTLSKVNDEIVEIESEIIELKKASSQRFA